VIKYNFFISHRSFRFLPIKKKKKDFVFSVYKLHRSITTPIIVYSRVLLCDVLSTSTNQIKVPLSLSRHSDMYSHQNVYLIRHAYIIQCHRINIATVYNTVKFYNYYAKGLKYMLEAKDEKKLRKK
jgi:hypothetical protein